jgi:CRP-like cAMP-binding protein
MIEALLRRLRHRVDLSDEEETAIRSSFSETRELRADSLVVRQGQPLDESLLLLLGWVARSKGMADGRRHLSILHVAGDFVDLHGYTLQRLDHDLITLSDSKVAVAPHKAIAELTARFPRVGCLYWYLTNVDAAMHREWSSALGTCSAIERMAQLFCELLARLEAVGLADSNCFEFPLTQVEVGELLGLTPVHVNRTLQELRRRGLIEVEARRACLLDVQGLQTLARFKGDYLYQERSRS